MTQPLLTECSCPVPMHDGKACGRIPYGELTQCILHAPIDRKDASAFGRAFSAMFREPGGVLSIGMRYSATATFNHFDCSRFVFPLDVPLPRIVDRDVTFDHAEFFGPADFADRQFLGTATFNGCVFHASATFDRALLQGGAEFGEARFEGPATFRDSTFEEPTSFRGARFAATADFVDVTFVSREDAAPAIADFRDVQFMGATTFVRVNSNAPQGWRVRLAGSTLRNVSFSEVNWLHSMGRFLLQDEVDVMSRPSDARFDQIREAYRELMQQFDHDRINDLAEDAYWGLMEATRRDPERFLFAAVFRKAYRSNSSAYRLGSQLSLINIYRVASYYGSSYTRALKVLLLIIAVFGVIYSLPAVGLANGSTPRVAAGLWHGIEVASFSRSPVFTVQSPIGKAIETSESLVVPIQAGLILLAVRRRLAR